jgi:hypothetical protein
MTGVEVADRVWRARVVDVRWERRSPVSANYIPVEVYFILLIQLALLIYRVNSKIPPH